MGNWPCGGGDRSKRPLPNTPNLRHTLLPIDGYTFFRSIDQYTNNFVRLRFTIDTRETKGYGTGIIIHKTPQGALFVLTCLHNLIEKRDEDRFIITGSHQYTDLEIVVEGKTIPVRYCEQIRHPQCYDLAILTFQTTQQPKIKQVQLKVPISQTSNPPIQVFVFGYASEPGADVYALKASSPCVLQLEKDSQQNIMKAGYECMTMPGFSGAPIFEIQNNTIRIIGVHTYQDNKSRKKHGIAFTESILKWISSKIQRASYASDMERAQEEVSSSTNTTVNLADFSYLSEEQQRKFIPCINHRRFKPVKVLNAVALNLTDTSVQKFLQFTNLQSLFIDNNQISNDMFILLLLRIPKLRVLEARHNLITHQAIENLQEKLQGKSLNLSSLMLCNLGKKINQYTLLRLLSYLKRLETLQIGYDSSTNRLHTIICMASLKTQQNSLYSQYIQARISGNVLPQIIHQYEEAMYMKRIAQLKCQEAQCIIEQKYLNKTQNYGKFDKIRVKEQKKMITGLLQITKQQYKKRVNQFDESLCVPYCASSYCIR